MKHIVLDTKILLLAPSIVTSWGSNLQFIIPDFVAKRIEWLRNKEGSASNVDLVKTSFEHGLISITQPVVQLPEDSTQKQGLQNEELQRGCTPTEINTLRFPEIQRKLTSSLTTIHSLEDSETILKYQRRNLNFSLGLGALVASIVILVSLNINEIVSTFNVWSLGISILMFGLLFYWFKSRFRLVYGMTEFAFGFVCLYNFFIYNFDLHILETVNLVKVLGSFCVMVRGLENISEGIKGTEFEPLWQRVFGE